MMKDQIRKKAKAIRKHCTLDRAAQAQFKKYLYGIFPQSTDKIIAGYDAIYSELDLSFLGLDMQIPHVEEGNRLLSFEREPDIFLVPLLAFDEEGYRIGYGGGYYDTTLAYFRTKKHITAIGVAYEEQLWPAPLLREAHDQKLDYIVTPKRVRKYIS